MDQPRRVALVGGASSGLGAATAQALAARGLDVAVCARSTEQVERIATDLTDTQQVRCIGVHLDLRDEASVAAAVRSTEEKLGPVDVLVLNGGGPPPGTATELDTPTARSAADLLLYGHLDLIRATLPGMRERGWGRVIAIGSSAVQQPISGLTASSMFRSALAAYLKLLASEVAGDGVTVNMVVPGRIDTDRVAELDAMRAERSGSTSAAVRAQSQAGIPAGRYGTPEELAAVVAFLTDPAAGYLTGEQIRVDGGLVSAP